jgi:hypothetical protein
MKTLRFKTVILSSVILVFAACGGSEKETTESPNPPESAPTSSSEQKPEKIERGKLNEILKRLAAAKTTEEKNQVMQELKEHLEYLSKRPNNNAQTRNPMEIPFTFGQFGSPQ